MKINPIKRLSDLGLGLATLFLLAMMIHVSADVVLKYVLNRPIPGTLEIVSAYYMVGGVFLPIAMVEILRASISVDVAYQFMPRGMKAFCMFFGILASAAVYLVLAWTSWGDAMRSLTINEVMMGTVMVSVWPSRFVLPFSFLLAGAVCLWYLYQFFTSEEVRTRLIEAKEAEEEV